MLSHSGKPLPSQDYFVQTCGRKMRSHAYFYYGKEEEEEEEEYSDVETGCKLQQVIRQSK